MPVDFGIAEKRILDLFKPNETFKYENKIYKVVLSGKPTCHNGEPKTDIYILAKSDSDEIEIKISFKKSNADFLENKINAERAEQIFGENWSTIIKNSVLKLENEFKSKPLVFIDGSGHTEEGSITLGWKFELLNVKSGKLSDKIDLTESQIIDIYAGTNLSLDKKNATVNGKTINNCGTANYIIIEDKPISNIQNAVNNLIPITDYVKKFPNIYFACKALNFRTYKLKYDGNRPLSVYVEWFINKDNKLDANIIFDNPLINGGDDAVKNLAYSLSNLGITTTKELTRKNLSDNVIINGTLPN